MGQHGTFKDDLKIPKYKPVRGRNRQSEFKETCRVTLPRHLNEFEQYLPQRESAKGKCNEITTVVMCKLNILYF